eukprot:CAMPEP_0178985760 /NCGR_PEP_ID=MMETSP0795-20121207/2327_1 /TAXON_ID=88552 /ORGANISM="Amoebophrya sp., Strain Ameob2" /LENGTH=1456 /DNA_ID=CAMNT_0020676745 /DNA_START=291 /DNA_END=4657 /DNA_ORIENTATION=+
MCEFYIDRGGTFTDFFIRLPDGACKTLKLLSVDPKNYDDAPTEGIRRVLVDYYGGSDEELRRRLARNKKIPTRYVKAIRMGTTVATNALLEREGASVLYLTTRGHEDMLAIGNQARPEIFDLQVKVPDVLYQAVLGVEERVYPSSAAGGSRSAAAGRGTSSASPATATATAPSAPPSSIFVERPLDVERAGARIAQKIAEMAATRRKTSKPTRSPSNEHCADDEEDVSIAINLLHSYAFPDHEQQLATWCREKLPEVQLLENATSTSLGADGVVKPKSVNVSVSSTLCPMKKAVPRGFTTTVDAYLTPKVRRYVEQFLSRFDESDDDYASFCQQRLFFMQSDGGLTSAAGFTGFKAIVSGPAGGCVGFSRTTPLYYKNDQHFDPTNKNFCNKDKPMPVIGFDMGGTSTDVSRYDPASGAFNEVLESEIAGFLVQAPQLDINTVAAGGGSRLWFRNCIMDVGPESAKAHPGPVCYRRENGVLAVTDANVYLNRILVDLFPAIFGEKENEKLDRAKAGDALEKIAAEINRANVAGGSDENRSCSSCGVKSAEEIAWGFLEIANEKMCRPIRELSESRGYNVKDHVLACFGGAGPQHVCAIARALGIRKAFVHKHSGILSAYGMGLADVTNEFSESAAAVFRETKVALPEEDPDGQESFRAALRAGFGSLREKCASGLSAQGFNIGNEAGAFQYFLHLRYAGNDNVLMVEAQATSSVDPSAFDFRSAFYAQFRETYGFDLGTQREILVEDVRVKGTGRLSTRQLLREVEAVVEPISDGDIGHARCAAVYDMFEPLRAKSWVQAPVYLLDHRTGDHSWGLLADCVGGGVTRKDLAEEHQPPILNPGDAIAGPAWILDATTTCVLDVACVATVTAEKSLQIDVGTEQTVAERASRITTLERSLEAWRRHLGFETSSSGVRGSKVEVETSEASSSTATVPATTVSPASRPDAASLSVYGHKFMSIAEQCGRVLQRTAVSVNIKERLDFSCAIFSADGGLVANAPHVPVHLGAMAETIRGQMQIRKEELREASTSAATYDKVWVTNDPFLGGSHLPDITVITPVFVRDDAAIDGDAPDSQSFSPPARSSPAGSRCPRPEKNSGFDDPLPEPPPQRQKLLFFVACRGHHADIGGISAGSMPAYSKFLHEEGAIVGSELLVSGGKFNEARMRDLFRESRNLEDVVSDLKAQVAANFRGRELLLEMVRDKGEETVLSYMSFVQDHARQAVEAMLEAVCEKYGRNTFEAEDYMDCGTKIQLRVTIDRASAPAQASSTSTSSPIIETTTAPAGTTTATRATFDFSGTGPQKPDANINAPKAITSAAVMYCLRCLVDMDIPLNSGCLAPIAIQLPERSLLNPEPGLAVCAGNVTTSMRVTDVILKAFHAAAASQGCMNNCSFGNRAFGYYETIAGGSGATEGRSGTSGKQCHMTNTRMTDVEVLESQYPVLLREFALRTNSGGPGRWRG